MELGNNYQQTLENLSESLRAERRQRFLELLAQTDTRPFIPSPAEAPEVQIITVS